MNTSHWSVLFTQVWICSSLFRSMPIMSVTIRGTGSVMGTFTDSAVRKLSKNGGVTRVYSDRYPENPQPKVSSLLEEHKNLSTAKTKVFHERILQDKRFIEFKLWRFARYWAGSRSFLFRFLIDLLSFQWPLVRLKWFESIWISRSNRFQSLMLLGF